MVRRLLIFGALLTAFAPAARAAGHPEAATLDRELAHRAHAARGHSRVILLLAPGVSADDAVRSLRGTLGRHLTAGGSQVVDVPDSALEALAALPGVRGVKLDRPVQGTLERTGATIGSGWVHDTLGYDGTGVGVAVIDSGVTNWHDDLGSDRVTRFVDFVNFQTAPYDDYGHGTHVAGIIAGNGHDSDGRRRGIAPGATLLVEKVLDQSGQGYISNVIAAIDYAIANKDALHLRIINLSVAAGVYESYTTDPLTLAAKRAVDAGLIVVSAAGNLGRSADGSAQYGAIGAPGNAPWVITVGASSHNGTPDRSDDIVAPFSSRGPTALDLQAKPDLVAPGVGIESLADAGRTLFNTKPTMRLWGTVATATEPYLSLSGTSMAAPVVSATIALMLQADPALTPNLVKAVLQYTAENNARYNPFTEGAGFLNARGAVELAQALASGGPLAHTAQGDPTPWSMQVLWGNHRITGGMLRATGSAWRGDVIWGSGQTPDGKDVTWGVVCSADAPCDSNTPGTGKRVWGTSTRIDSLSGLGTGTVWGSRTDGEPDNIVWGTECGGADCDTTVSVTSAHGGSDSVVWGRSAGGEGDNIVWGTASDDEGANIVWATNVLDDTDNIVWGAAALRRPSRAVSSDHATR